MATEIWVNIGSGNGLLPDGTKPLPEPMLTDHQWSPVTIILGQFDRRCLNHQPLKLISKSHIWNSIQISQGQWVNCLNVCLDFHPLSCSNLFACKIQKSIYMHILWFISDLMLHCEAIWASWCPKSHKTVLFVQRLVESDNKETINGWNLQTTRGFLSQRASNADSVSTSWRLNVMK